MPRSLARAGAPSGASLQHLALPHWGLLAVPRMPTRQHTHRALPGASITLRCVLLCRRAPQRRDGPGGLHRLCAGLGPPLAARRHQVLFPNHGPAEKGKRPPFLALLVVERMPCRVASCVQRSERLAALGSKPPPPQVADGSHPSARARLQLLLPPSAGWCQANAVCACAIAAACACLRAR